MMRRIPNTPYWRCTDCGRMLPNGEEHQCKKLLGNMLAKQIGTRCNKLKREAKKLLNMLGRDWKDEHLDAAARVFHEGQQGKDRVKSLKTAKRMVLAAVRTLHRDKE